MVLSDQLKKARAADNEVADSNVYYIEFITAFIDRRLMETW